MSRALRAGIVWVNCWMVRDLRLPFGGVKASGVGREGGKWALDFYTEQKHVVSVTQPWRAIWCAHSTRARAECTRLSLVAAVHGGAARYAVSLGSRARGEARRKPAHYGRILRHEPCSACVRCALLACHARCSYTQLRDDGIRCGTARPRVCAQAAAGRGKIEFAQLGHATAREGIMR